MRALPLFFAVQLWAQSPEIKVRQGTTIGNLPLERYVAGVLAGESAVFQSNEATKAMAVAARTFAIRMRGRHRSEGFDLCDTTHCQRLDLRAVTPRLAAAAADTAGELLWFEGKPALTPYARDCGGRTEAVAAIWPGVAAPYLTSHDDAYCVRAGRSAWQWSGDPEKIVGALRRSGLSSPRLLDRISILDRTVSGRASTLLLSGGGESMRISADPFRFAMGRELGWNTVRGDRYDIRASNGRMIFEGQGAGHGVGLCQLGAEQMGLTGLPYRDILAFYYPGTQVGLTGRGLAWQRLGGETLALLTTQPDQDKTALAIAERLAADQTRRTGWPLPQKIEIRAYPDLDTFRDATGEPGWVAAHTQGRRIDLQPVSVLQSKKALEPTLAHELLHVLVESQAASTLPLWFREGLTGYLESGRGTGVAHVPDDADLRQTGDAVRARRAYADAIAEVASLAQSYGETTVLGWVKRGLPPEVTKASASQAATKSK